MQTSGMNTTHGWGVAESNSVLFASSKPRTWWTRSGIGIKDTPCQSHTFTENQRKVLQTLQNFPTTSKVAHRMIRVLLKTSRWPSTVQKGGERNAWSEVITHFERTPQLRSAFQGRCLDMESHLFVHSLQPKFFLGLHDHQSHRAPRHHQLSATQQRIKQCNQNTQRRYLFEYNSNFCHHFQTAI